MRPGPGRKPGRRGSLRLLVVAAVAGALLAGGGVWVGTYLGGGGVHEVAEPEIWSFPARSEPSSSASGTTAADWVAHNEKAMNAVLSLPRPYERLRAKGGKNDQPRTVTYDGEDVIQVRLTQWDKAPASPMAQAKDSTDIVEGDGKAGAQYTRTSFQDQEAVLADTTHYLDGTPTRVMELIIRTDDSRMYELRVDMPKGTADEKKGTAVFKGARERLKILGM